MSININKKETNYMYYYSDDNGTTYGPFSLDELLPKVNHETLVYREGIQWTNASNVEELKKYFKKIETPSTETITPTYSDVVYTQRLFSAPFSFDGRIRRLEYGISLIIYVFGYAFILGIMTQESITSLLIIPMLWFLFAQGAKRCHDLGRSGWYQLIPFYALWMLFAEGDNFENEYGNSPK